MKPVDKFSFDDFRGEFASEFTPSDVRAAIDRMIDPAQAVETIHWGRNYLYRTRIAGPDGPLDVVVKQFRNQSKKAQVDRKYRGSKAERSWRAARAYEAAEIPTAPTVALIESTREDGPSYFVVEYLEDVMEARYLLRAVNAGTADEEFPKIDVEHFLRTLGATLRKMHAAGLFHRDLSIGNVLLTDDPDLLYIIDLNRTRIRERLGVRLRTRDLSRLALFRNQERRLFLEAYWEQPTLLHRMLYRLYHHGFHGKITFKKKWRGLTGRFRDWIVPRKAYAHIPEAPEDASAREKSVWDHLSDQPHNHAGRMEKTMVRILDIGSHFRHFVAMVLILPRVWKKYRTLQAKQFQPHDWDGVGLCVRPMPEAPDQLLQAIDDLDVRHVLIRLHPWEEGDEDELALARALFERGLELSFALPQVRALVRDPERWRRRIEEIAERFTPYGKTFQVGQAINRSKWGIWSHDEFLRLAHIAREILDRYEGVEMIGPGVIDFELHVTAGVLNLDRKLRFDALASLLYVDRRGAPENEQIGFDTPGKITLSQAIAEAAGNCAPRSWITEVNWPLWEGPHSPAGRSVSVSEPMQAEYLARFYLLALGTGHAERVFWWQLAARGYGLAVLEKDEESAEESPPHLRRRQSFDALQTLERELRGSRFLRLLPSEEGVWQMLFELPTKDASPGDAPPEMLVAWCTEGTRKIRLPRATRRIVELTGESTESTGQKPGKEQEVEISGAVRYFYLS